MPLLELRAGGPDDPQLRRTTAVLHAYVELQETRAFCRRFWRYLALLALAGTGLAIAAPAISAAGLMRGLACLVLAAAAAGLVQWWKRIRLLALVAARRAPEPRHFAR